MNVPVPLATAAVSVCSTTTWSTFTPNPEATTWANVVWLPWPIAGELVCTRTAPAGLSQTRAESTPGIPIIPLPTNVFEPPPVNSV